MKKHLKYWQKLYLAVLLLFVISLGAGFWAFAQYSVNGSFAAKKDAFLYAQHSVAEQLSGDLKAVLERNPEAVPDLFHLYEERLKKQGYRFLGVGGSSVEGSLAHEDLPELAEAGHRVWQVITEQKSGHRLLYAATSFDEELQGYGFGLAEDIESFYTDWHASILRYTILGALLTVFFAVGLFLVLRLLNQPVRELEEKTLRIAEGEREIRPAKVDERTDELGELARTLNAMSRQVEAQLKTLKEESEARQMLIDDLSHEMRTPLTAIKGYAAYLQRAGQDEKSLYESTEVIRKESDRLLKLSEQLLRLSTLENEPLDLEPLDVQEVLPFAVETVGSKAEDRQVHMQWEKGEPLEIKGERTLLESLFINLLDNAVKACEKGGQVRIRTDGSTVLIEDNGRGMDQETLKHIGQPFFRADKARSRAEGGAGLGVSLCQAIAKAHQARLVYESEPGAGTKVFVIFYNSETTC